MRKPLRTVFLSLGMSASGLLADTASPLPAFPGAEGFGGDATGGRGGEVYHVTTLNDAGPGSFRDAVSKPKRVVVFDVGGVIALKSNVEVAADTTVAGQTARGEGVCLYGGSVSLSGKSNIVSAISGFAAASRATAARSRSE